MAQPQNIQWFPGHMTKTRRQIEKLLPICDAVAEIVDARIPLSSRNPDLQAMIAGKPLVVLLNKCDMADAGITRAWLQFFKRNGVPPLAVDCRSGKGLNGFSPLLKARLGDKLAEYKAKGMVGKPLRVMVVGIPNVGKSSFINRMAGGSKAKVEDRPGVTRGNQWFRIDRQLEILDTPGVLWPKFDDPIVGERLAFTGAVKDTVLDMEALACRLLACLAADYAPLLCARYKLDTLPEDSYEALCAIGRKRGMVGRGGTVDTERAAAMLLDEFRAGKIGRITMERP